MRKDRCIDCAIAFFDSKASTVKWLVHSCSNWNCETIACLGYTSPYSRTSSLWRSLKGGAGGDEIWEPAIRSVPLQHHWICVILTSRNLGPQNQYAIPDIGSIYCKKRKVSLSFSEFLQKKVKPLKDLAGGFKPFQNVLVGAITPLVQSKHASSTYH